MNWYNGSIAEAVNSSKQKKAIFVVFVQGSDENSIKLTRFLDEPKIREKIEGDNFVAIRIEGGSESYTQFARIYQIVPVPSLFFIGNDGTPLEVATGVIASADELGRKIENVLRSSGKSSAASSASAAFISAEQKSDTESLVSTTPTTETTEEEIQTKDLSDSADSKSAFVEPKTADDTVPTTSSLSSSELPTSILDTQPEMSVDPEPEREPTISPEESPKPKDFLNDAICYKRPNYETTPSQLQHAASAEETADPQSENASTCAESISMDTIPTTPPTVPTPPATPPEIKTPAKQTPAATPNSEKGALENLPASPVAATNTDAKAKLERERVLLEERRKLKQAEEDRQAREGELSRRKEGKNAQNVQKWQKEEDFKEVRENIRRDKLKDEAARQRTLELIASDRAERANKCSPPAASASPNAAGTTPAPLNASSTSDVCRIQFRIPNGGTSTQSFQSSDTFDTLRAYVKSEVIKGTGIRDFILATTFPKHEFTVEDDAQTLLALGLCPSAVILVIAKASSGPSAVVARSGGVINVFNTIFWALMSPMMAVFGYLRNFIIGRNDGDANARASTTGAQKRANDDTIDANDSAKKRNLDRFALNKDGPSTSKDALATANSTGGAYRRSGGSNIHRLSDQRKDSDDENNTWNGNSTQQQ